jgi:hypothetical protein
MTLGRRGWDPDKFIVAKVGNGEEGDWSVGGELEGENVRVFCSCLLQYSSSSLGGHFILSSAAFGMGQFLPSSLFGTFWPIPLPFTVIWHFFKKLKNKI